MVKGYQSHINNYKLRKRFFKQNFARQYKYLYLLIQNHLLKYSIFIPYKFIYRKSQPVKYLLCSLQCIQNNILCFFIARLFFYLFRAVVDYYIKSNSIDFVELCDSTQIKIIINVNLYTYTALYSILYYIQVYIYLDVQCVSGQSTERLILNFYCYCRRSCDIIAADIPNLCIYSNRII